jgi:hypothetical protein
MAAQKNRVRNYIEEFIKGYHNAIISSKFTEDIIVFLEIEESFDDFDIRVNSLSFAKKLAAVVKEKLAQPIAVGLGKGYVGIENLSKSYDEAVAALRSAAADMKVKHYEDILEGSVQSDRVIFHNRAISGEEKELESLLHNANSAGNEILSKAKKFIKNNYKRDITLEEVADR